MHGQLTACGASPGALLRLDAMRQSSGDVPLGAAAAAGCLGLGDAAAFALGDEVAALLDLAEDAIALDGLAEAGEEVFRGFALTDLDDGQTAYSLSGGRRDAR
jgi:hypothetical protein